ncbi:MAG TPA: efflux RND transporter periplasmic adaptor subunit [Thermoanaerobaculia bacterium]|nr:efflux RND transporter periplasmic adaptor subunit [Thermoanaerobaculia bacterium]
MKKAIWILLVVVAAVGLYFAIRGRRKPEPKYQTAVADKGNITMTVTATGSVSAVTTVQVGSQVSGIISKLFVDFNSHVKKGQLLAELDPTPFEAQVEQQRATLAKAQVDTANALITFNRQKRLLEDGLAAQSDFDAAKAAYDGARAQVDMAKATLAQAETNLKYTKIVSPIDGVVVARQYDVGQTVAASFQAPTLFTIAQDLTKMQVQADVDESDIGRVAVGQQARFTVDAYPEQAFRGTVSQVRLNATSNQNVITYPVIIAVPNPDEKLRPTMTANVTIDVAMVRDVLRVPNAALRFRPPAAAEKGEKAAEKSEKGEAPAGPTPPAKQGGSGTRPSFDRGAAQMAEKGKGFAGAAGAFALGAERRRANPNLQTIYLVEGEKEQLKSVSVRTGISDGRMTQIVDGEIQPGDKIAVGLATLKSTGGGTRPPGMGRF